MKHLAEFKQVIARGRALCLATVGTLFVMGCFNGCDLTPQVGPPLQERCENVDSDPNTHVSWTTDIQPLFDTFAGGCATCHFPDGPTPVGVTVGGLDLSTYGAMRKGGARSGSNIVLAGRPCDSILFQKILPGPPFGAQMPANGPPFLTPLDEQLLKDWITEGALNN